MLLFGRIEAPACPNLLHTNTSYTTACPTHIGGYYFSVLPLMRERDRCWRKRVLIVSTAGWRSELCLKSLRLAISRLPYSEILVAAGRILAHCRSSSAPFPDPVQKDHLARAAIPGIVPRLDCAPCLPSSLRREQSSLWRNGRQLAGAPPGTGRSLTTVGGGPHPSSSQQSHPLTGAHGGETARSLRPSQRYRPRSFQIQI